MKISNKKRQPRKGIVLPAVFAVLLVLAFVVLGITTMSTSSLRYTTFSVQDDQALYAAKGNGRNRLEARQTGRKT